jgi:hypothetical protein
VRPVPTLAAKLGFGPDARSLVVGPAPAVVVDELFAPHRRPSAAPYDVILAFCRSRRDLDAYLDRLPQRLTSAGGLWLAWPKRSSGVVTDVGEADVRQAGLACGLVDNKIAAVDDVWSGLRFVRRRSDR